MYPEDQGQLVESRIITVDSEITEELANDIIAKLLFLQMQDPNAPINLHIDSPGGQVTASLAVYDTMEFVSCPIHSFGVGLAAGTSLLLLVAGEPGERSCSNKSSLGFVPGVSVSNPQESSAKTDKFVLELNDKLAKLFLKHTKMTEDILADWRNKCCGHMVEIPLWQAMDQGFIDKVVEADCRP